MLHLSFFFFFKTVVATIATGQLLVQETRRHCCTCSLRFTIAIIFLHFKPWGQSLLHCPTFLLSRKMLKQAKEKSSQYAA